MQKVNIQCLETLKENNIQVSVSLLNPNLKLSAKSSTKQVKKNKKHTPKSDELWADNKRHIQHPLRFWIINYSKLGNLLSAMLNILSCQLGGCQLLGSASFQRKNPKVKTSCSNRLKQKLRPILAFGLERKKEDVIHVARSFYDKIGSTLFAHEIITIIILQVITDFKQNMTILMCFLPSFFFLGETTCKLSEHQTFSSPGVIPVLNGKI